MTLKAAYYLRNMIHEADRAAKAERAELLSKLPRTDYTESLIKEIERERDLACVASLKIWEVREAPEGHTDPAIKLWNALRRASEINFSRWAPVMMTAFAFFRGIPLTLNPQ